MRKSAIIIGLSALFVLIISAVVYSYFSPQLTLKGIREAAKAQDTERLRDLVDFDSVRAGLKDDIRAMVNTSAAQDLRGNPFAALGVALAGAIVDPLVGALVNPATIVSAVSQGKLDVAALQKRANVPKGLRQKHHPQRTARLRPRPQAARRRKRSRSKGNMTAILVIALPCGRQMRSPRTRSA